MKPKAILFILNMVLYNCTFSQISSTLVQPTENLKAQNPLIFNKRFIDCENKWVAFPMAKDSSYMYGFIYIDEVAGLTLDLDGSFRISLNNSFVPDKIDREKMSYKKRLPVSDQKVAIIPYSKFTELKITALPDWLKYYQHDTSSVERLQKWGYYYNVWNECARALNYLERAYKIDPEYKGISYELGFAYNCIGQYNKALSILKKAILKTNDNCELYRELSYAQLHVGELDSASETYKTTISICSDTQVKSEMAFNITYQYYKLKDKEKFKYWAAETKKLTTAGDRMSNMLNALENNLFKKE